MRSKSCITESFCYKKKPSRNKDRWKECLLGMQILDWAVYDRSAGVVSIINIHWIYITTLFGTSSVVSFFIQLTLCFISIKRQYSIGCLKDYDCYFQKLVYIYEHSWIFLLSSLALNLHIVTKWLGWPVIKSRHNLTHLLYWASKDLRKLRVFFYAKHRYKPNYKDIGFSTLFKI